jgi:hypothetical protein
MDSVTGFLSKRKFCMAASLVTIISFLSSDAQAKSALLWKTVGNWHIGVDQTLRFGCFMLAGYEGGDMLRIGFDPRDKTGYMLFGNAAWRSLTKGNRYPVEIQFDNYPFWKMTTLAVIIGNGTIPLLYTPFNDPTILRELEDSQVMTVLYNGRVATKMRLNGSQLALMEMLHCQKDMIASTQSRQSTDPFASQSSTDPFSR